MGTVMADEVEGDDGMSVIEQRQTIRMTMSGIG
jgi:hypothetical protein